jgi:hypothetical protein
MSIDTTRYYVNFVAPALPQPSSVYSVEYQNQLNNTLRIYFNNVDKAVRDSYISDASEANSWFLS